MRRLIYLATMLTAAVAGLVTGPILLAQASEDEADGGARAVFVQTNNPSGNTIVAYRRHQDGTLSWAATYPTGGNGGRAAGSASDPLASQGSLVYDSEHALLFALNAGSDSISVFAVDGDHLRLDQVVASGGPFPNSIAVHGNLAYVLDAGLSGSVSGYRIDDGALSPIPGSSRSLGLPGTINPPNFLAAPAQVGFTPDGGQLIVTTKTNGTVDAFTVLSDGRLSSEPTKTPEGPVPFAFVFDPLGQLVLVTAGNGVTSTELVNGDGTLTLVSAGPSSGQAAACWITKARGTYFIGNTGSGSISAYRIDDAGIVTLSNATAAAGIAGVIDMAASRGGHFLYAESGGTGSVRGFAVGEDGSLSPIASDSVPGGQSLEGIVAF